MSETVKQESVSTPQSSGNPCGAPCYNAVRKEVIGDCVLYQGDCLDVLPGLNADICLTSPPYNLGGFHQMHNGNSAKWEYEGFSDSKPEADYQEDQIKVLQALLLIGCKVLFYSHKNRIVDSRLISPLEWVPKSGWVVHQQVVLNKGSGANVDKRRFFPVHEVLLVCFNSPTVKLHNSGCFTDVWHVEQTNRKVAKHPAVMPMSAAEKALSATGGGGRVVDPYMGSGTSALAAIKQGLQFVGIERSEKYFDIACERITEAYRTKPRLFEATGITEQPKQQGLF